MKQLPVYETFFSWQGEGCHMGKSAFFIRLFGCPVHCPWCDSAGTWHPDHVPETVDRFNPEDLAELAASERPELVVVTGGEPAIHDLTALASALKTKGQTVHLETSGAFPIQGDFDWITLSPKVWKKPIQSAIERAHEFKLIVDSQSSIDLWEKEIGRYWEDRPVWLHPEWFQRGDPQILSLINQKVKERSFTYRAGYQMHKLFQVDEADERSKPTIKLI